VLLCPALPLPADVEAEEVEAFVDVDHPGQRCAGGCESSLRLGLHE
jgi:hypothetical protein